MNNKSESKPFKSKRKIKSCIEIYGKTILFQLLIIILTLAILFFLHIPFLRVVDGSLFAIVLALPVTFYNWMVGKRERFFNDNIELLVNINKDEYDNDELIDLRLTQLNYIYENKIKSDDETELEQTIINTVSRLVLNGISVNDKIGYDNDKIRYDNDEIRYDNDEIGYDDVKKIYKRLEIKKKEASEENVVQHGKCYRTIKNSAKWSQSKFKVVNDLFLKSKNPLILKSDDSRTEIFVYLNQEIELSGQVNNERKICLIADSVLYVNNKDYFDNFKSFSLYDSKIKFAKPLTKDDFYEFKNDESISNSIKRIHSSNSVQDKYFKELINSQGIESAELEAKLNWIDKNLRVSDRKQYRDIIRNKYENSFIKFSRSYAKASEPNVRAGWFCINESTYHMIYDDNKFSTFFFIINANPDIESQEDGICVQFDKETMKKYFDKKEGDSFAINKDKYGNKLYQFYLYYEKDSKLLLDNRVKSGEPLKIKLINSMN